MNELLNISILAKSESGVVEVLFFVVVAVLGIVGSIVSSLKKKQQEQQEQQRLKTLRNEAMAENDHAQDDWIVVDQEPIPVPPPVRSQKVAINDFVKPERRRLVPSEPQHKPEPTPVPIPTPKPVRLQSSGMEKIQLPSSRPPKVVHNRAAVRGKSRLATPRNHSDVHSTVPCDEASKPFTEAAKTTLQFSAAAARQAMIYHEIFSQPKALRDSHELWD